jgi:hypothetical protein
MVLMQNLSNLTITQAKETPHLYCFWFGGGFNPPFNPPLKASDEHFFQRTQGIQSHQDDDQGGDT